MEGVTNADIFFCVLYWVMKSNTSHGSYTELEFIESSIWVHWFYQLMIVNWSSSNDLLRVRWVEWYACLLYFYLSGFCDTCVGSLIYLIFSFFLVSY